MLLSVFLVSLCVFAAKADDSEASHSPSQQFKENEQTEKFIAAIMKCSNKHNVPPNYFTMILSGEAPLYENAKCFVKCSMESLHYLNEDGSFNDQVVREVVQRFFTEPSAQEKAINTWLNCEKQSHSEQYADDSCDRAYNLFMCYAEQMSKAYINEETLMDQ
nr:odorant binding protein 8 [Graphosoma rubrolineatum]